MLCVIKHNINVTAVPSIRLSVVKAHVDDSSSAYI